MIVLPPLEADRAPELHGGKGVPTSSMFAGPQRVSAVAVSTAGLLGAGIGGLFGVLAVRKQRDADTLCPDYDRCDPRGLALSADAVNDARISTAIIVSGAIALGIGVVLFLTAPGVKHHRPEVAGGFVPAIPFR
jgi:hypothetical protein